MSLKLTIPVKLIWQTTGDETRATRGAFRLALLTGQRIGSVLAMRWDGITGDLWTIPPEHFKGRRTHVVPLSNEAYEGVEELKETAYSDTMGLSVAGKSEETPFDEHGPLALQGPQ